MVPRARGSNARTSHPASAALKHECAMAAAVSAVPARNASPLPRAPNVMGATTCVEPSTRVEEAIHAAQCAQRQR